MNVGFGAVFVPSNDENRKLRRKLQENDPVFSNNSYVGSLNIIAGDPIARGGRGEWYSKIGEPGELVIQNTQIVSDEEAKSRLEAKGFKDLRIIQNKNLGEPNMPVL